MADSDSAMTAPALVRALAFALALALPSSVLAEDEPAPAPAPESLAPRLADWVAASGDNNGAPFVVIDKVAATVSVYEPGGKLIASEPALFGSAPGDDSSPGVGDRELSDIKPEERTTPAGRFVAGYGPSQGFGRVLWVDWASAISMHPVVTANKAERRLERLQSPTPEDNRISYGCINVSAAFYDEVVKPTFETARGIVYILPEAKPIEAVFPGFALSLQSAALP